MQELAPDNLMKHDLMAMYLPSDVLNWAGMCHDMATHLAKLNDMSLGFHDDGSEYAIDDNWSKHVIPFLEDFISNDD